MVKVMKLLLQLYSVVLVQVLLLSEVTDAQQRPALAQELSLKADLPSQKLLKSSKQPALVYDVASGRVWE